MSNELNIYDVMLSHLDGLRGEFAEMRKRQNETIEAIATLKAQMKIVLYVYGAAIIGGGGYIFEQALK